MNYKKVLVSTISLIIAAFFLVITQQHNSLTRARNEVREQRAQVENVLQSRIEKIPDLVAAVKSYCKHEETVFKEISEARAGVQTAIENNDTEQMAKANEQLTTALTKLVAVVEAYPELQSSKLYIGLMDEIAGASNRVTQERRVYNQKVRKYNDKIETFPSIIYAKFLGFEPEKYFEAVPEAYNTNVVDFGD